MIERTVASGILRAGVTFRLLVSGEDVTAKMIGHLIRRLELDREMLREDEEAEAARLAETVAAVPADEAPSPSPKD